MNDAFWLPLFSPVMQRADVGKPGSAPEPRPQFDLAAVTKAPDPYAVPPAPPKAQKTAPVPFGVEQSQVDAMWRATQDLSR